MTLRTLALKSLKYHSRSYLAYFLSSSFSVWVFFLYASLIFHPDILKSLGSQHILVLFFVIEVIVALFAILFIGYSQSAFLKNRSRDLGLLQMLGMSVSQCARLVFWENLWIGGLSLATGIGFGILFSKFFFLSVSRMFLFPKPIPFYLSVTALGWTIGFYLALFMVLSAWSRFSIRKMSVAELFRDQVRLKKNPEFRPWKVMVGISAIGIAYGLAWTSEIIDLATRMIPIVGLVLIGTFLLFSQMSVAAIGWLERIPSIYYRGKNLILLSQLRFRLKDHARVLFLVSVFASVVLTSVGVCLTYYLEAERAAVAQAPYHLSVDEEASSISPQTWKSWFRKHKLTIKREMQFKLLRVESDRGEQTIIAERDFRRVVGASREKAPPIPSLREGETFLALNSQMGSKGVRNVPTVPVEFQMGTKKISLQQKAVYTHYSLNEHDTTRMMRVIPDQMFQSLEKTADQTQIIAFHLYQLDNWKKSKPLVEEWSKMKKGSTLQGVNGTYLVFSIIQGIFSALLFVSLFVGVLFFLAAGSVLYFHCFLELESDRRQMVVLQKLGINRRDAVGILDGQLRILFILPFLVALVHGGVALKMFSFLFNQPFWNVYGIVAVSYAAVHGLYYLWTRHHYLQSVLEGPKSL